MKVYKLRFSRVKIFDLIIVPDLLSEATYTRS